MDPSQFLSMVKDFARPHRVFDKTDTTESTTRCRPGVCRQHFVLHTFCSTHCGRPPATTDRGPPSAANWCGELVRRIGAANWSREMWQPISAANLCGESFGAQKRGEFPRRILAANLSCRTSAAEALRRTVPGGRGEFNNLLRNFAALSSPPGGSPFPSPLGCPVCCPGGIALFAQKLPHSAGGRT